MAIVKLRKISLYGQANKRDQILADLQQLGCVHLIDIANKGGKEAWQHPLRSNMHEAVRYLESCPNHRPQAAHATGYGPYKISAEVIHNRESQRDLKEEQEELVRAVAAVRPWGDFQVPAGQALGGRELWFYRPRLRQMKAFLETANELGLAWTKVARDLEFQYVVVVAVDQPRGLPVSPVELDRRPLSELKRRLEVVEQELETLEMQRLALTRWVCHLKADLDSADDETARMQAAEQTLYDDDLFALQGWVPKKTISELEQFAAREGLALSVQKPTRNDEPPTLLTNPRAVAGAEGAVTFYMTPSYRAWDPTWIMYFSFSLFFAMIMADAGYGLVLAAILMIIFKKLGRTESLRRFRYLAIFMVGVTIVYGVIIGSYFGISPPEGSFLDRLVWKTGGASIMNDQAAMMLLSAGIGVFHLALANLVVAWRRLGSGRALSHVGWAATLVGGLVMAIAKLPDPALVPWLAERFGQTAESLSDQLWGWGSFLLAGGLGAVFFFTSDRPLFSTQLSDWLWRPLEGLMGLTNISKAFGDALSYLRLFALGLASAQLAITFNQLASNVSDVKGVGLFLGLLIFLAGHTLNLVLGIVGGVVHGLRLNCIEFFSWSLTDEGYPFRAFCKKADG